MSYHSTEAQPWDIHSYDHSQSTLPHDDISTSFIPSATDSSRYGRRRILPPRTEEDGRAFVNDVLGEEGGPRPSFMDDPSYFDGEARVTIQGMEYGEYLRANQEAAEREEELARQLEQQRQFDLSTDSQQRHPPFFGEYTPTDEYNHQYSYQSQNSSTGSQPFGGETSYGNQYGNDTQSSGYDTGYLIDNSQQSHAYGGYDTETTAYTDYPSSSQFSHVSNSS